jgi:epoxide hydrolase-like predicted phosphatase
MGEIRAVVFDVGGVLVHPPAVGDLAPDGLFGSAEIDSDHPWHRLERGEITIAEVQRLVGGPQLPADRPPGPVPPYTLGADFVELAEQLAAAGFALALCTNAVRELVSLWWGLYAWDELFDVVVRSYEIGARKPDPAILRATMARLGTRPEETIFVDDVTANIETAQRLGMVTVRVGPDRTAALARVRELTGLAADAPRATVRPPALRRPAARNRADELLLAVLFDADVRADPYPLLHELRAIAPVHQLAGRPVWYVSRYADCRTVLRDRRFVKVASGPTLDFVTGEAVPPPPPGAVPPLPFLDPPWHTAVRPVMGAGFTRSRLGALEPRVVATAEDVLGPLLRDGGGEVVERVSYPMAIRVICDLVGVPERDRDMFRRLVREASMTFEPGLSPRDMFVAVSAIFTMTDYFSRLARAVRAGSPGGMLAMLLTEADAHAVPEQDVVASVVFLFSAGFETVAHLISTTLFLLATHPDELGVLRNQPELAAAAVEEAGRFHSPVQLDSRMVGEDVELSGVRIPANQVAVTLLGAANRDPASYVDPDRFDVRRQGPAPLTFGSGIHYCLGAALAALEASTIVRCLLAAGITRLEVAEGGLTWKEAMVLRGFDRLTVAVG